MTESKKKFRIRGVPYGKSVTSYAERLEKEMNELVEEGYQITVNEQKNGTVVIGQLVETRAVPSFLRALAAREEAREKAAADDAHLSPRTKELMSRVYPLFERKPDIATFEREVEKHAVSLTRGFGAEELATAARELDAAAVAHEAEEDHSPECSYPQALRAVAAIARSTMHTRLQ